MQTFIRTNYINSQVRKGVKFNEAYSHWSTKSHTLRKYKNYFENTKIKYPNYFVDNIHTYENGHLNWEQAYHSECHMQVSAMMSLADIANQHTDINTISPIDAYSMYKNHIANQIIGEFNHNTALIADFGCGSCDLISSIASQFPHIYIFGIDLSPNYLSMAHYKYKHLHNLVLFHSNIEKTEFADNTFDIITINFVFHEMIPSAINNSISEAYRLLKPNGKLIIIDMDPTELPPYPSFIDISEPHLKSYRTVNIRSELIANGFKVKRKRIHANSSVFIGNKSLKQPYFT